MAPSPDARGGLRLSRPSSCAWPPLCGEVGTGVISCKALEARGFLDGWEEGVGELQEDEGHVCVPICRHVSVFFVSMCMSIFYSFYFVIWVALGPNPLGAIGETVHKCPALWVQDL